MSKRTWTWRHAVLDSDLPATTRHVLLTIGCYMNEVGGGCYPTIDTLASATGLSERAVRMHIGVAKEAGWLIVKEHGFRGQKWRNHEYEAAWPEAKPKASESAEDRTEPPAESQRTGAEQIEEAAEPDAAPSEVQVRNVVPEGAEPPAKKVRNDVPPILPEHTSKILPPDARKRAEGGRDFSEFWEGWPIDHRPDNRGYVEKLFLALSPADRLIAAGCIEVYRRAMVLRGRKPKLVTFLKDRLFEEFHDCPPLDGDGDFVIKPNRPEWRSWLAHRRAKFGEAGVQSAVRSGLVVTKDRWPPGSLPLLDGEAAE